MFRDLPKYVKKRASGYWGVDVPEHWREAPGLAVLEENRSKNDGLIEGRVLSLSYGKVVVKPVEKQRGLVPESYEGYQILDPGDIVVRPTDLQNDQTSIRIGHVRNRGIITSAYIGLRPRGDWNSDYAFQYLTVIDSSKLIYGMGSGLRQQLGWADLKRLPCLVPPAEEQAAIVKYLAHANARIDNAIAAKRRLVALLEEQQALSAREVVALATDQASESKESGLDWLGKVPSSWTKYRLKVLVRDIDDRSMDGSEEVLSVSHITGVTPRSEKTITMFEAASYVGHKTCRPGDVVVNTMWAWMGALGLARTTGIVSPAYNVYRTNRSDSVEPGFLALLLRSRPYVDLFRMLSTGVRPSRLRFYPDQMLATPVFLPSLDEQRRILLAVEADSKQGSHAIEKVEREIRLLQEFRTRLVADVVTGQVDVRAVAATLPDTPMSVLVADDVPAEADGLWEDGDE